METKGRDYIRLDKGKVDTHAIHQLLLICRPFFFF
jgi:hypothetical protein